MNGEYDIFEKLPNDEVMWRGSVCGRDTAIARLQELAAGSPNEHFVLHVPSKEVVARINTSSTSSASDNSARA